MLERIRSLVVILEEGSVNRASARLRLSQPALSRQIQALEHEIGAPLLERGPWGVRPTDLGYELLKEMKPVLAAFDLAFSRLQGSARGERQELRIGYLGSAANRFLTPALAAARQRMPDTKFRFLDLSPAEQLKALSEGVLEVAMIGQEGASAATEFYARKLATLPVCVALPAQHPKADAPSLKLAELKSDLFIGADESEVPGRNAWTTALCKKAGFRPRYLGNANSITELWAMLTGEQAVALLPDYFETRMMAGIRLVPVADAWARWDFIVLRQRGNSSPQARTFIELLVQSAVERANAGKKSLENKDV